MIEKRPGQDVTLETRRIANEQVEKKLRYSQILEVLNNREMTAKELAYEMFLKGYIPTDERNFTSPRLTELCIKGIVEPIGKKKCLWTNKMVTVYRRVKWSLEN